VLQDNGGAVGIGTSEPESQVHVVNSAGWSTALWVDGGGRTGVVAIGGANGHAGFFSGNVHVTGTLFKGANQFTIDHPLDPGRRYLSHGAVESDEMKNVYDGLVELDAAGAAEVVLPPWFEALNEHFRYQLTPIGGPAPELHVAREIDGNRFAIAGGTPGGRVCWQLTGVRHDAFARAQPLVVEREKPADDHGRYLHPEPFGQPGAQQINPC
jgi:hypothetical protein